MTKLGVHKHWNQKFLLKEVTKRVIEHAGLSPDQLAGYRELELEREQALTAYAAQSQDFDLGDISVLTLKLHGLRLMREGEYSIYEHGETECCKLALGVRHKLLALLFTFARNAVLLGTAPHPWRSSLSEVGETLALTYALGWNAPADKLGELALEMMPLRALWSAEDCDPRWEKRREPFARFTLSLYADFAGVTLPPLPPHPYASPAYDVMLACWRDPDPQALVSPLLDVCDWHTHECMYSRSDKPSKNVDFINDTLMGWPVEVHMIYRLRERLGLALPAALDHPLMRAPLGPYLPPQPVPHDERLDRVIRRAYTEVPGLEKVLGDVL